MENYIVRIYQRRSDNPEFLVGYVEDVATGNRYAFHCAAEMTALLAKAEYADCAHTINKQEKKLESV